MATVALFDLLGQALGHQPSGVVNFNQLHRLLLEIISHLGHLHETTREQTTTFVQTDASNLSIGATASSHEQVAAAQSIRADVGRVDGVPVPVAAPATLNAADSASQHVDTSDNQEEKDISMSVHEGDASPGVEKTNVERQEGNKLEEAWSRHTIDKTQSASLSRAASHWQPLVGRIDSARSLAAINDVSVLENRLGRIETRLNAMETLPEAMKRAAEGGKPVSDMWHYTSLEKRMDATEQSIDRVMSLVGICYGLLSFCVGVCSQAVSLMR